MKTKSSGGQKVEPAKRVDGAHFKETKGGMDVATFLGANANQVECAPSRESSRSPPSTGLSASIWQHASRAVDVTNCFVSSDTVEKSVNRLSHLEKGDCWRLSAALNSAPPVA